MHKSHRPLNNKKFYILLMTLILAGLFLVFAFAGSGFASLPHLAGDAYFPVLVNNIGSSSTPTPTHTSFIPTQTSTATATPTRTATATSQSNCTVVSIVDFNFSPASVTISTGGCVRWVNNGSFTHTSTSDTGVWDSGLLTSGQSFTFTFTSPGTYPYFCGVHPSMTATVTVN